MLMWKIFKAMSTDEERDAIGDKCEDKNDPSAIDNIPHCLSYS